MSYRVGCWETCIKRRWKIYTSYISLKQWGNVMVNLREILFSHIFICIYAKKVVPSTSSPINDGDPFESTVAFCGAYAKADIFLPSLAALLFYADTYPLMQA